MRLLVTRPLAQAAPWIEVLRARGVDAHALPLIGIAPVADPAPVQRAWRGLASYALAVFVSPSAVASFFALRPDGAPWPDGLRAATPGPGSAAALREAGVLHVIEPDPHAARFDSEGLWAELEGEAWGGRRVLVVRGDGGREWLAERLRERGADVRFVQAYRRTLPALDDGARTVLADALAHPQSCVWHFSSAQAIDHLAQLAPEADWSRSVALASHPRIAARARAAGFGTVREVAPTPGAVAAALQHGDLQSARP